MPSLSIPHPEPAPDNPEDALTWTLAQVCAKLNCSRGFLTKLDALGLLCPLPHSRHKHYWVEAVRAYASGQALPAVRTVGDLQKRYTGPGSNRKATKGTALPPTTPFPKQTSPKKLTKLDRDTAFIAAKGDELKKRGSSGWDGKTMHFKVPSGLVASFAWTKVGKADLLVLQGVGLG